MQGLALVLAGGGGKGAYHIGVWKALREFGVDKNITAVAGTSVGALNAAFFMQGNYGLAEKVWRNISHNKLLAIAPDKIVATLVNLGLTSIFSMSQIIAFSLKFSQHGIFSREGLIEILNENLNLNYISNSNLLGFATCCELPFLNTTYFSLNNCTSDRLQSILLASSALPIIFGKEEIDGNKYIDGGMRDNLPIKPLYDKGYKQIIVVHLDRGSTIEHACFPDTNIIEILPQNHQGNIMNGTLDFSPEGSARRIEEGYKDTVRIFKPIYEMGLYQHKTHLILREMKVNESQFSTRRNRLLDERTSIKVEINDLMNNGGIKNDT
ncbi:patatin-like phospholipase family protein [Paenibacillus sp. GCM10028914]|uniref:patatin-like phospholipase family protein n=1 Tax=Paenibacillus sp. GCM10028914 TaxID=3273416 RepID=UPI003616838C